MKQPGNKVFAQNFTFRDSLDDIKREIEGGKHIFAENGELILQSVTTEENGDIKTRTLRYADVSIEMTLGLHEREETEHVDYAIIPGRLVIRGVWDRKTLVHMVKEIKTYGTGYQVAVTCCGRELSLRNSDRGDLRVITPERADKSKYDYCPKCLT